MKSTRCTEAGSSRCSMGWEGGGASVRGGSAGCAQAARDGGASTFQNVMAVSPPASTCRLSYSASVSADTCACRGGEGVWAVDGKGKDE